MRLPRDAEPAMPSLKQWAVVLWDASWSRAYALVNWDCLATLTRRYLRTSRACLPHVSHPVLMHNSTNVPLYALFLASHNQTAVKIMNDLFKKYVWTKI